MNKTILLYAALAVGLPGAAQAQAEAPAYELSFNASVVSDYRYRGLSQTRREPALQGGVDYAHSGTGLYAGAWASTIKWTKDTGGGGSVEIDLYAGKTGKIGNGLSYDIGGLYYAYPGNDFDRLGAGFADANTFELYGKLGYGPAYIKYSHALTDLFGADNTRGSGYMDVGADLEIAQGYVLNLHVGRQRIRNIGGSYNDWSVGVSKDFGIAEASLAVVGTNIDVFASNGKNISKNGLVLSVSKTF